MRDVENVSAKKIREGSSRGDPMVDGVVLVGD